MFYCKFYFTCNRSLGFEPEAVTAAAAAAAAVTDDVDDDGKVNVGDKR